VETILLFGLLIPQLYTTIMYHPAGTISSTAASRLYTAHCTARWTTREQPDNTALHCCGRVEWWIVSRT